VKAGGSVSAMLAQGAAAGTDFSERKCGSRLSDWVTSRSADL
jgi:hypothetical protein